MPPTASKFGRGQLLSKQHGSASINNIWFWLFLAGSLMTIYLASQALFAPDDFASDVSQLSVNKANTGSADLNSIDQTEAKKTVLSEEDQREVVTSLAFHTPLSGVDDDDFTRVNSGVEDSDYAEARPQLEPVLGGGGLEPQDQRVQLPKTLEVDPEEFQSLQKIDINYLIEQWRQAWESGDSETYLSFYSLQFIPADDLSYSDWHSRRKRLVVPSKKISLGLSNFDVILDDLNRQSIVSFDQEYISSSYSDTSRKQLTLIKESEWRIIAEKIVD